MGGGLSEACPMVELSEDQPCPETRPPPCTAKQGEKKPETRGSRATRETGNQTPDTDKRLETVRLETLEISNLRETLMFIYRICGCIIP